MAYAPFILTYVFDFQLSISQMVVACPFLVLFTVAAPGLPAGAGTALWTATLFASILGLPEDQQSEVVVTWVALSGGVPDMIRTATNCTGDGCAAIFMNRLFPTKSDPPPPTEPAPPSLAV
jgi:Na+/H+-dicarboxylate symporter